MAYDLSKKRKFRDTTKDGPVRAKKFKLQRNKLQRKYSSDSEDSDANDNGQFVASDAPKATEARRSTKRKQQPAVISHEDSNRKALQTSKASTFDEHDDLKDKIGGAEGSVDGDQEARDGLLPSDEEITDASNSDSASDSDSDIADHSIPQGTAPKKTKRHDPTAFANSLSAILSSKLPTSKRTDPVLSRSKDAKTANHELVESKLEAKAKRKMREEKRLASEKGRVKDVLLGDRSDVNVLSAASDAAGTNASGPSAAEIAEQERRLRKTAQRGVVKLFNAVRAAQVRVEEETRKAKMKGIVGLQQREERVGEMGRKAFLELVSSGGKTA